MVLDDQRTEGPVKYPRQAVVPDSLDDLLCVRGCDVLHELAEGASEIFAGVRAGGKGEEEVVEDPGVLDERDSGSVKWMAQSDEMQLEMVLLRVGRGLPSLKDELKRARRRCRFDASVLACKRGQPNQRSIATKDP